MRLVDGDQRQLHAVQPFQNVWPQQGFGCDIEKVQRAVMNVAPQRAPLVGWQVRIERCRPHARLPQGRHLVGHERQQRRHDEPHAGPRDGGDLVAERLAAARRHQHEGVVAGNDMLDDARLRPPERIIAVDGLEDFEGSSVHWQASGITGTASIAVSPRSWSLMDISTRPPQQFRRRAESDPGCGTTVVPVPVPPCRAVPDRSQRPRQARRTAVPLPGRSLAAR